MSRAHRFGASPFTLASRISLPVFSLSHHTFQIGILSHSLSLSVFSLSHIHSHNLFVSFTICPQLHSTPYSTGSLLISHGRPTPVALDPQERVRARGSPTGQAPNTLLQDTS
jgi:hypothetical protein